MHQDASGEDKIPTDTVVLTFDSPKPPSEIRAGTELRIALCKRAWYRIQCSSAWYTIMNLELAKLGPLRDDNLREQNSRSTECMVARRLQRSSLAPRHHLTYGMKIYGSGTVGLLSVWALAISSAHLWL
ncbi:hypothetical protein PoB_000134000 [Plakobranchus ocellatus]|uniref:SH3 domain-containing protein n=1 Tax=Plakobranchus ocellatus TaxID=259542 RepID=A0AAV3XW46_9GAST|nr:hypothetical protein PoB_000134000 [Plakobranchus ocellatus]